MEESRQDGVVVIQVRGSMMTGHEVNPLHERVKALVSGGESKLIVDLSEAAWFGSAMLGVLAACMMLLDKAGGEIRLAGPAQSVRTIFTVTHMASVFAIDDSVDASVAKLR